MENFSLSRPLRPFRSGKLERSSLLGLYRDLLRTVRTFPSKKRLSIREDIRVTFREGARLRNARGVAAAVEVGVRGLETMRKYTTLDKNASHWSVTLDQAPLGDGPAQPAFAAVGSGAAGVRKL